MLLPAVPPLLLQEGPPPEGPNMLFVMAVIFLIFWFVMIRPARNEQKRKQQMLDEIKKSDKVITSGGLYATVAAVGEKELTIKFDDGPTRVKILRSSISTVLNKDDEGETKS